MKYLKEYNQFNLISEKLQYHLDNNISLHDNVFRYGSKEFFTTINEARELYNNNVINLTESDLELIKTDIGLKGIYEDKQVWLDIPMVNEAEYKGKEVELNKPKRGGKKKFYVYTKNPETGNIIKVEFGAKKGGQKLSVKLDDPKARKRYDSRHGCSKGKHNDKTKPGYWSCRLPKFQKLLKLSPKTKGQWW
mgnify:FL=1